MFQAGPFQFTKQRTASLSPLRHISWFELSIWGIPKLSFRLLPEAMSHVCPRLCQPIVLILSPTTATVELPRLPLVHATAGVTLAALSAARDAPVSDCHICGRLTGFINFGGWTRHLEQVYCGTFSSQLVCL